MTPPNWYFFISDCMLLFISVRGSALSSVPQVLKRSIIICVTFCVVLISDTMVCMVFSSELVLPQPERAGQNSMHAARASAASLIDLFVFIEFPFVLQDGPGASRISLTARADPDSYILNNYCENTV